MTIINDIVKEKKITKLQQKFLILQNYKKMVLVQIKKDGYLLRYASNELKSNKEVVLAAVKENGMALEFASEKLRSGISCN